MTTLNNKSSKHLEHSRDLDLSRRFVVALESVTYYKKTTTQSRPRDANDIHMHHYCTEFSSIHALGNRGKSGFLMPVTLDKNKASLAHFPCTQEDASMTQRIHGVRSIDRDASGLKSQKEEADCFICQGRYTARKSADQCNISRR